MEKRFFTSESVTEGHPDKVCDQIADAILDDIYAEDNSARVAIEVCATTGMVMVLGEVSTDHYSDIPAIVRGVIKDIGYDDSSLGFDYKTCAVISSLDEQSPDIAQGVDSATDSESEEDEFERQGAGDQGMMFGYACNETDDYMPLSLALSHILLIELAAIRKEGKEMTYLRPDSKSQVTIEYNNEGYPERVHTIVVSTQHDEFITANDFISQEEADVAMVKQIHEDVENILLPRVLEKYPYLAKYFKGDIILHVNPTGKFVIGGPHGDTGLTGRKIIVDTYGGKGAHGGGAFSGKDPSKVDRSAAYAARHIAKNLVAAGVSDEILVQVAYAIGVAEPVSLYINTYGKSKVAMSDVEIAERVLKIFDMRPYAIEQRLKLRNPIYAETASYGHMGRTPRTVTKCYETRYEPYRCYEVELFTWEKLDFVDAVKTEFNL